MSSTTSTVNHAWPTVASPILASSIATVPVFYGLCMKSARQLSSPLPPSSFLAILYKGVCAAPTFGLITGVQIFTQNTMEKRLASIQASPALSVISSAVATGAMSAPLLAVFNGQTIGQSVIASLKALKLKQFSAIVTREAVFLTALRVSELVNKKIQEHGSHHKALESGIAFASGAFGSLAGHPADTALTRWQKGLKIENFQQLARGGLIRAVSIGMLFVIYRPTHALIAEAITY